MTERRLVIVGGLGVVGAALFDTATFLAMISTHGLSAELNPVVTWLVEQVGLAGLLAVRAAVVLFACGSIAVLAHVRPALAGAVALVGTTAGFGAGLTNVWALLG